MILSWDLSFWFLTKIGCKWVSDRPAEPPLDLKIFSGEFFPRTFIFSQDFLTELLVDLQTVDLQKMYRRQISQENCFQRKVCAIRYTIF